MSRNELVDLMLFIHVETDLAYRVSDTGEDKDGVWVPKSQVEIEETPSDRTGRTAIFTMPEWLAIDKKLV